CHDGCPVRSHLLKMSRQRKRNQNGDEEPAIVQANLNSGDPAKFNLRAQVAAFTGKGSLTKTMRVTRMGIAHERDYSVGRVRAGTKVGIAEIARNRKTKSQKRRAKSYLR